MVSRYALTFFIVAAPQALQPPSFDDLLGDLAAAVAGAVASHEQVHIVTGDAALVRELRHRLGDRGVRVADVSAAAVTMSFTCSETVRERVCAAELRRGDERTFLSVSGRYRPLDPAERPLVLQLRPLVATQDAILDVALVGDRLLVLHPAAIARYARATDEWHLQDVRPTLSRTWPRDVRGRLTADKASVEAFLPGASCRGRTDLLQLACTDEARSWPIGIENGGVARSRNYFALADGRRYYAAAALGPDAGARWIAAAVDGGLEFLDDAARALTAAGRGGDEVASVSTTCAQGTHLVLTEPVAGIRDIEALRLFRVADRRLLPVTPPTALSGILTALWPTPHGDSVTAVSYNHSMLRYEAFQVSVSCGR